jgi:hypothetical protein
MGTAALTLAPRHDDSSAPLALPDRLWTMPDNLAEAMELSTIIAGSTLCPNSYRNKPGDVFVAAKFGQALGLSIMQSVIAIAVINGRPGIFGDDMLAVVQAHPAYEGHKEFWEGEGDNLVAVCQVKRRGQEVHESRFSVADAKTANLWDTREKITGRDGNPMSNPAPWHCYPKRMLMMRARAFALRDKFADALRGMKCVEELQDYPNTIEASFPPAPAAAEQTTPMQSAATNGNGNGDPAAAVLKQEASAFAAEWHNAAKANHSSKEGRAFLKDVLKVDTSLDIKPEQREQAMVWANTKPSPVEQAAATTTATAKQEPEKPAVSPFSQLFEILGWTVAERKDYLGKMGKFSEAQIKADLNRQIEERDAQQK